ncbi:hypothetical protein KNO15_21030 [Leifsonia shinshuensis]|uniref:hypothetical protein n=1 Tax=Leifsonia shinshuensis TaxID=150026 RepID=UPI001F50E508|nr:hypothetical protein [Leifsonia shinshuensis]MCI0159193.1 hypothetical protein [Leifsonia shinshuensis]
MDDDRIPHRALRAADIVATIVLGVLQLIASFTLPILGWFQLMSVASCSERECDYALLGISGYLTAIVAALAFVATLVFVILRAVRGRSTWWLTCIGLAAVVVAYVIATALNELARA